MQLWQANSYTEPAIDLLNKMMRQFRHERFIRFVQEEVDFLQTLFLPLTDTINPLIYSRVIRWMKIIAHKPDHGGG